MTPPKRDDDDEPRLIEWDGIERRKTPPAMALNSWPAIQSFATLILMAIAGIAWGLKLETRLDVEEKNLSEVKTQVLTNYQDVRNALAKGILPIAEVRIAWLENEIKELRGELADCVGRVKR